MQPQDPEPEVDLRCRCGLHVRMERRASDRCRRGAKGIAALVPLLLVSTGCSGSPDRSASPTSTTNPRTATTTLSRAICATPTRFGVGAAANELRGESSDAQLWGLALGPGHVPPRVGDELKIVWRMTGAGPLRVTFTAPTGQVQPLVFGPEAHPASSYHRPGDEWGTGFFFATPGCWHIHFTRTNASADVWLNV